MKREQVEELAESLGVEFVNLDGLESAIIGLTNHDGSYRLVYSAERIIKKFVSDGMSDDDAREWAEFNVFNAHFGDTTPIIVNGISLFE